MLISQNTFALKSKVDNYAIFKQLEIFTKIVESRSLSVAALKLNLTPSAISRSLKKLEQQLGVILLKRTTRNVILTDAGHYLYQRANNLLVDLECSLVNTSSFYHHPQGQLKITCSIAFGTTHLIKLFSEYREDNPEVTLSVDLNDELVNLNEENFDIALRITATPPINFAIRKISEIPWIYCASKQYLAKRGVPRTMSDLKQHDCLINPNVISAWSEKDSNGNQVPIKINNTIQANSSLALLQAALNHQGIVCLPTYMLQEHISSNRLVPVLLAHSAKESDYHLYALYSPSKYSNPKIRSFIDFLVEKFRYYAPWDERMKDHPLPSLINQTNSLRLAD